MCNNRAMLLLDIDLETYGLQLKFVMILKCID